MNNKSININRIIKIVALISIIFMFIYILTNTYSKYITERDYGATGSISKWHILVNNNNISQEIDEVNLIDCVLDANPNIAPGVVAPTSTGYFDVDLESTGTEVPFEYKFKLKDVDVDYSSSYELQWHGNSWGNNGVYTYQIELTFDYSYLEDPIWYYWEVPWELRDKYRDLGTDAPEYNNQGNWGYANYDQAFVISLQMPNNWIPTGTNNVYNCTNVQIDAENKILSFTPEHWAWGSESVRKPLPSHPEVILTNYSNNKFSCFFHLTFSSPDVSLSESISGVVAGGRVLSEASLPDFKITGYSYGETEINNRVIRDLSADELYDETTGFLSGTVYPPKNPDGTFTGEEVIQKFRFYVEWYDGPDNVFDNEEDVKVLKSDNIEAAKITFAINVTQIEDTT